MTVFREHDPYRSLPPDVYAKGLGIFVGLCLVGIVMAALVIHGIRWLITCDSCLTNWRLP